MFDRDYSQTFTVKLEWHEWNKLHNMYARAMDSKDYESWGDDEHSRDQQLRDKLTTRIGDNSPGNGIDDWPDSMKEAYDESIQQMLEEIE